MPIYTYRCDQCGHERDVLQKLADAPPACPQCGHASMSKQVTAAAFDLKGSGWYKTDFAGKCPVASQSGGAMPPCASGGGCCCKAAD